MTILPKQTFSIIKEEISHCLFQTFQSCFLSNANLSGFYWFLLFNYSFSSLPSEYLTIGLVQGSILQTEL